MDKKIAHTQAGSKDKPKFNDNSAYNQRLKILDWLFEKGSITTDQARTYLSVMSPAPRILELRRAGYLINTLPETFTDNADVKHPKTARYVLVQKMPIERDKNSGGAYDVPPVI